jgi:hypothetical protein
VEKVQNGSGYVGKGMEYFGKSHLIRKKNESFFL